MEEQIEKIDIVNVVLKYDLEGKVGHITAEEKSSFGRELFISKDEEYRKMCGKVMANIHRTLRHSLFKTLAVAIFETGDMAVSVFYGSIGSYEKDKVTIHIYDNEKSLLVPRTIIADLRWTEAKKRIRKILESQPGKGSL